MSSPLNSPCGPSPRSTDRGSAIISVLVLAAVTSVIAAGFLFRSSQEAKMATRSFYDAAALNLAEAAVEEALFSLNTGAASTANGWTVPSDSSTSLVKTISGGFNFPQGTGAIYLRIDGINTATPTLTVAGVVIMLNQRPIVKQIRITGTKRQVFTGGIVAKGGVTMSGNNTIDGFDSSQGAYNTVTNRTDRGSICARSVATSGGGSKEVYGYATHHPETEWPSSCRVRGATTPSGVDVDSTRVRTDYSVNLSDSTAPTRITRELGNITSSMTLPRSGDVPDPNTGRYHYHCSRVNLNDEDNITINGPCDIISDNDVNCNDNASITVGGSGHESEASFSLYTSKNVYMGGRGINNRTTSPGKAAIWGTCDSDHSHSVRFNCGGRTQKVAVYCPNASVRCDDDEIHGAMICNTLALNGNAKCHYDTQLANIAMDPNGDNNVVGVSTLKLGSWAELTAAPGSGNAFARDNRVPFNNLF